MLGREHYVKLQRKVGIALVILFLALIAFAIYFLIFYPTPCPDSQCFVDSMANCKRASWIREDSQATWVYTIKGNSKGDLCKVEINLLKIKQGDLDTEKLQGKEMICLVHKGETQFPEKDISRCEGELKEEMQDLVIQRMHNYILENLGDIQHT